MPVSTDMVDAWHRAGYSDLKGSYPVVPPPPSGFVRAYHITAADHAISGISLRRLKVARFSDVNDPFELLALNLRERKLRNVARQFKDAYDSDTGLLCFSADWTNPVLWSHYGAKHRGICLGFVLPKSDVQEVQYESERFMGVLGEEGDPLNLDEELQRRVLCTKFDHWRYESELRMFVPLESADREGKLYFRRFDANLQLDEVILGAQCDLSVDAVRGLVSVHFPHATTYKARLAFKTFTIVADSSTVP